MIAFLFSVAVFCFSPIDGRPRSDVLIRDIYDVGELFSELPEYEDNDLIMLKLATLSMLPVIKTSKKENLPHGVDKYEVKLVQRSLDDIISQLQNVRSQIELEDANIKDDIEKAFENLKELMYYLQEDGSFVNSNNDDGSAEQIFFDLIGSETTGKVLQPSKLNQTKDITQNLASAAQFPTDSTEPVIIDELLPIFTETGKDDEVSENLKSENTNPKKEKYINYVFNTIDGGAKKFYEDIDYALFNKKKLWKNGLKEA